MWWTVALGLGASEGLAADASTPHPHRGVLRAYDGPPPRPTLTEADLATLGSGRPVLQQAQTTTGAGAAGRALAVQDVHAPPNAVWARITDFGAYPRMVDHVLECEPYASDGDHLRVRFVIGAPLVRIEYFIDHTYRPAEGWMTWRLDYDHTSDLDDSVGYWRVDPIAGPGGAQWSRVTYSVELKAAGYVPAPLERAFATIGLTKATAWVKAESEASGR
ncbi:MAG: SRPBCC family protein [Myxococcota bacterium]